MLQIHFLEKTFPNPLVLASGILGVTGASMARVIRNGAGGVTMKSVTSDVVEGNPNPVMLGEKTYFLNAVGLPGPGIEVAMEELKRFRELSSDGMLIGSIFGRTVEEFGEVTERICESPIDFLEIDISCPHASHLYTKPFAHDLSAIEQITTLVKKKSSLPIIMKLSPNTWQIAEYAKVSEAAGADAITAVNTLSGMTMNVEARRPVLANAVGGVSGPALKPIALKAVWDIFSAVHIPIIGTGGVTNGRDAVEMMMAGATLVGVGSAFYYRGEEALRLIAEEMEVLLQQEGFSSASEIVGIAHDSFNA